MSQHKPVYCIGLKPRKKNVQTNKQTRRTTTPTTAKTARTIIVINIWKRSGENDKMFSLLSFRFFLFFFFFCSFPSFWQCTTWFTIRCSTGICNGYGWCHNRTVAYTVFRWICGKILRLNGRTAHKKWTTFFWKISLRFRLKRSKFHFHQIWIEKLHHGDVKPLLKCASWSPYCGLPLGLKATFRAHIACLWPTQAACVCVSSTVQRNKASATQCSQLSRQEGPIGGKGSCHNDGSRARMCVTTTTTTEAQVFKVFIKT